VQMSKINNSHSFILTGIVLRLMNQSYHKRFQR